MKSAKLQKFLLVPIVLSLLSLVFLVLPLISMFANVDAAQAWKILQQPALGQAVGRSVTASLLTTAISLPLAYGMAWCMERTAMAGKRWFQILLVLPMMIPSVSIGMGVVLLCGNSGILTELLGLPSGSVYGLPGIVWGSVMYALPLAFLMIQNILKFEDSTPYEAATVLGLSRWQKFRTITLPYLRRPMIAAAFSVFTLSFTDYGVPLMVGGKYKTLPVIMYQEVIGQLNFGKGCVYGSILLIPALIAFILDFRNQNNANASHVARPMLLSRRPLRDRAAFGFCTLMALAGILPIAAFVVLAFVKNYPTDMSLTLMNLVKTMQMGGGKYLINSVAISLLTALGGVAVAVVAAYYTARNKGPVSRVLHLLCMSMAAIPGIVLGLAYVLLFKGTPLYGTLLILILVNVVHFFASPYLMIYNSFSKVDENMEAVAWTLDIGRKQLLLDILLPMCQNTVVEMFSYFFVNSMMTISAVSFLANSRTKPIALMINQFEAQAQMEYAAVVSLAILGINLVVKVVSQRGSGKNKED